MSMDFDEYMEYREKKVQSTLDEFEIVEEELKIELSVKQKFILDLMRMPDYWNDLEKPLLVLDKAKINAYVASHGYEGYWVIDLGIYACSLCRKDGSKHKLHNVNYIGYICQECREKYQTQIQELMKNANALRIMNGSKRELKH